VPLEERAQAAQAAFGDPPVERADLERAIRELPETLRAVFVLKEVEGLSHAEVAGVLGIRIGTSEVRLHRAMKKLREYLEGTR